MPRRVDLVELVVGLVAAAAVVVELAVDAPLVASRCSTLLLLFVSVAKEVETHHDHHHTSERVRVPP